MGTPWNAGLPVIDVPQSDQPKDITLVMPYYENPVFLAGHIARMRGYPSHLLAHLRWIVVDDGSPLMPAADVLLGAEFGALQPRLFRIAQDVRWNWLAARNIGAFEAQTDWLLLTDMDHVLPPSTLDAAIYGRHQAGIIYGFSRIEHSGEPLAPHPNSWLMTREMFWRVGGYDEALSGHYGTDGDWRRRCAKTAPIQILRDRLVRYEHQDDASTTRYLRKQPEDAGVKGIIAGRREGWRPKVLSFPYREVPLPVAEVA